MLLPVEAATDRPVYFSEVQFQKDPQLYHRFFAEIFLYLAQNPQTQDWRGVLIYPDRSCEPTTAKLFQELLDGNRVQCIYLNELDTESEQPLGGSLVQLIVEPDATTPERARELVARLRQETISEVPGSVLIELIEIIMMYKFTALSREEIAAMLGIDAVTLKQTRVYQEAVEEGRQEGRQEERQRQRQMIESALQTRFGDLDEALAALVDPLLALPPDQVMPMLFNQSREELIARFTAEP